MKKLLIAVMLLGGLSSFSHAVDRSRTSSTSPTAGDNFSATKLSVSSFTASGLCPYSTSRGACTCVNDDSSNSVWIGSHTTISDSGSSSFPLYAKKIVEVKNNGQLYGLAPAGVVSVTVYCIYEW